MTRPRCTTVLRRFLEGDSLHTLVGWLRIDHVMPELNAWRYIEHCIRRGLRGEVKVPRPRSKK